MRRTGDATPGHDARWPLRGFRVAQLLSTGPHLRDDLARLAETVCNIRRTLVEDVLCAMENDGIVAAAPVPHLGRGERTELLRAARTASDRRVELAQATAALRLTAKGHVFLTTHKQDLDAGTCPCIWCADLAAIRAWVAETPIEEQQRLLLRSVAASRS